MDYTSAKIVRLKEQRDFYYKKALKIDDRIQRLESEYAKRNGMEDPHKVRIISSNVGQDKKQE